MKFFKPEDFSKADYPIPGMSPDIHPRHAADIANAKLEREGVRVTGVIKNSTVAVPFGQVLGAVDTHQALLIGIEELPKKPEVCEHESEKQPGGNLTTWYLPRCTHCGVKLKAKWEVAE